jgi:Raf kinase inhibitor-like YbhB/YbcL family protein
MKRTIAATAIAALAAIAGPASARDVGSLTVTSPAFSSGGAIPREYTCEGRSVSPPINWTAVPPDTQSIAVIADDPDAPSGTFEHFVAFNLPPAQRSLSSETATATPAKGMVARNSSGTSGFAPICPPSGVHHYRFQVMALDTTIARTTGASAADVASDINGHVLARGELVGTYQKSGR